MIGDSVPRVEDRRFLSGRGTYLADVSLPGTKQAAILRSPFAHARVREIDTANARDLPGVRAVFTGADLADVSTAIGHLVPLPSIKDFAYHVLATDKVRYVGEPVAVVVADSRYLAEDALEVIEVDYEELPAVVVPEAALRADAPILFEDWGTNEYFTLPFQHGDLDAAFAGADGVLIERFVHHRVAGLPLEGAGACGVYDRATGRLTLYASNQQPHNLRTVISDVTRLPEARVRVIAPDMGGGFGTKQHFIREESLVAVVAMLVPHPVMWLQDRVEAFTSGVHSREQVHHVEVAYRSDGRVLGIRAELIGDLGNPSIYFIGAAPVMVTATMLTGCYDIQDISTVVRAVVTNKAPSGAYRGFGQPQALFTIERIMDLVAAEVGVDPLEVRRRNLIPDEPRPYVSAAGFQFDTGSFHGQLDEALEAIGYDAVRSRQAVARDEGRLLGVGVVSLVEPTAPNLHGFAGRFGGFEMARLTVQPDGHVAVVAGTKSQGQGHETVLAQVAAEILTLPVDHVVVSEGDTDALPYGMGTWGSRSAVMGGGAVLKAAIEVREKMITIAAHMLEAPAEAIELAEGLFHAEVKSLPFAAVAQAAYLHTFLLPPGMDMGLGSEVAYDPGNTDAFPGPDGRMNAAATYATATEAVVVEVDPATGSVDVQDVVLVHDCGRVINPAVVDGQIQGGFAQGLGAVLLERLHYGSDGQLLTANLLDYHIPAFGSVPPVRIFHRETPSPLLGGFRGAGEAATIATPAALASAIEDALRPFGVRICQTDLRPAALRGLVRSASASRDGALHEVHRSREDVRPWHPTPA